MMGQVIYRLWALVGIRLLCPVWVESPFSLQPDLSGYYFLGERPGNSTAFPAEAAPLQELNSDGNAKVDAPNGEWKTEGSGENPLEGIWEKLPYTGAEDALEPLDFANKLTNGKEGFLNEKRYGILSIAYLAGAAGFFLFHFPKFICLMV